MIDGLVDQVTAFTGRFGTLIGDWPSGLNWTNVLVAIAIVVIAALLRKTLGNWAVKLTVYTANSIGVTIVDSVRAAITPAARTLVVSSAFLIAIELLDFPDRYKKRSSVSSSASWLRPCLSRPTS